MPLFPTGRLWGPPRQPGRRGRGGLQHLPQPQSRGEDDHPQGQLCLALKGLVSHTGSWPLPPQAHPERCGGTGARAAAAGRPQTVDQEPASGMHPGAPVAMHSPARCAGQDVIAACEDSQAHRGQRQSEARGGVGYCERWRNQRARRSLWANRERQGGTPRAARAEAADPLRAPEVPVRGLRTSPRG